MLFAQTLFMQRCNLKDRSSFPNEKINLEKCMVQGATILRFTKLNNLLWGGAIIKYSRLENAQQRSNTVNEDV